MTEQEWLVSNDPAAMLEWLTAERVRPDGTAAGRRPINGSDFQISDRKLRLFACGCCLLAHRKIADVDKWEVAGHHNRISDRQWAMSWVGSDLDLLSHTVRANVLRTIVGNPWRPVSLCGNRDHGSVVVRPYCPACRRILDHANGTVPKMAQVIYDERRWDDMPMLADALEESGCRDEEMLDHCRGTDLVKVCPWCVDSLPDPETNAIECSRCDGIGIIPSAREPIFVRGDWVIDILTGKE